MIIKNSFTSAATLQLLQLESQDLLWSCKREDIWGGEAWGASSHSQFHSGVQALELTLRYPTNWFWGKQPKKCGVCCRLISLGWKQAMAQIHGQRGCLVCCTAAGTCHGSRHVARCSPPPPVSAGHSLLGTLPLESCTALLPACSAPCWKWAKLFLKGGQVCPTWSPAPGSFEHSSVLPLPPNTCLTPGKPLNLSILKQNKDNTTSFSLNFVCLLQIRCKLLRVRFVFSVCSMPIKTEPWSQLGPWGTAAVLLLSLIIIITNAIRSKTLPVWVIFGVKLVIKKSNRYM